MYGAMKEGMIFHKLQCFFIWLLSPLSADQAEYWSKPLYACLFCMGSFWGVIFTSFYVQWEWSIGFMWEYAMLLFCIAGVNYLIATFIGFVHWMMEEED